MPILAWSAVLAVALYPVFNWLAKLLGGRPRTAAAILTIVNLGIVIGPATWLGLSAVDGVRELASELTAGDLVIPSPPEQVKEWPLVGPQLYEIWSHASSNIRAALREVAPYLKPLGGDDACACGQRRRGDTQISPVGFCGRLSVSLRSSTGRRAGGASFPTSFPSRANISWNWRARPSARSPRA